MPGFLSISYAAIVGTCLVSASSLKPIAELPKGCGNVQFVSTAVGWCGSYRAIFQTVDGGITWQKLQPPIRQIASPIPTDLWQFELLSPLIGWVQTSLGLYWTSDGGRTWIENPLPLKFYNEGDPQGIIDDIHFATAQVGWALGMREVPGDPRKETIRYRIATEHSVLVPALFRTSDGGGTWIPQQYPDQKRLPYRLTFADSEHGLSIELNETLYTRDGGHSWRESGYCPTVNARRLNYAIPGTGTFLRTAAQLLDAARGWWTVEGDLFRTNDGGATWCQLPSIRYKGEIIQIHELSFASRELGWAVPDSFGRSDPVPPFESTNGGLSWKPIKTPEGARTEGCSVVSSVIVFCWGDGRLFRLIND